MSWARSLNDDSSFVGTALRSPYTVVNASDGTPTLKHLRPERTELFEGSHEHPDSLWRKVAEITRQFSGSSVDGHLGTATRARNTAI
jgi:hypothetical protein